MNEEKMSRTGKETDLKKLSKICVKFGWDAFSKQYSGGLISGLLNKPMAIDCDGSAVFCDKAGRPISKDLDGCCVYYDNRSLFDSAVLHGGDNKTGEGADDEEIAMDLGRIPSQVDSILLTLDMLKEKKKIGTGKIQNAFVRITDAGSGEELCRCDFDGLCMGTKLIAAGKLQRSGSGWKFESFGKPLAVNSMREFIDCLERRPSFL